VLKRPKELDFRVQEEFGGSAVAADPPAALREDALRVIDLVSGPLLFARVDGVEVRGRLMLMELELIEPCLFLRADARAPERFADAIVSLC
jgi:hypothetical protein